MDQRLPFMPLDEVLATTQGDTSHKREMHTQDLIRHAPMLCAARVPQGRAPRGNMARQLFDPLPRTEKGKEKGTFWQIERSVAKTVDKMEGQARVRLGATKRKSELVASLIR